MNLRRIIRSLFLSSTLGALSLLSVFVPVFAVTAVTLPLTGCSVTAAEVAADGQAISNALVAIGAVYPSVAPQLDKAAQAVVAATANWTVGSTTALINDALQVAEAVLATIPQTAPVAALIPIAVAAIDILIAAIPPSAPTLSTNANARVATVNPYRGAAVIHHHMGRSMADDLKATWNGTVAQHPELAAARLK